MNVPQLTVGIRNFSSRPGTDWSYVLDQARAAEEAGIDRVFVVDHLVFGADLSPYGDPRSGGVTGGVQPTGPDGEWLEALTTLAAMTAVTNRVRLATNVLVVPLRSAVLLAKMTATLDALSGGRFELGAGIGWQEAEYRAAGVDFSDRGRILDETLEACRDLWTSPEASFAGRGFSLAGVYMMPKPKDPSGIPVWIGGRPLPRVARRLARFGAGWLPWGVTPQTFLRLREEMGLLVEAEGRDFSTVQVAYPLPTVLTTSHRLDYDTMLAPVAQLVEHGVSDFRTLVRIPADYAAARDFLCELRQRFDTALGASKALPTI
jgi:probable F420-dependent oxidoreductase